MEKLTGEEIELLDSFNKIGCIKLARARLKLDLKEAKDLVDYWEDKKNQIGL